MDASGGRGSTAGGGAVDVTQSLIREQGPKRLATARFPEVTLRWDSPLVAAVARELNQRLRGARLRALLPEFEAHRLSLYFREHTLVIRLHPTHSGLFMLDPVDPPADARPLASKVRAIEAPADERLMVFSLLRVRGSPARADLIIEWIANRHNAILTEGADRTIRMVFRTGTGARPLRPGLDYTLPTLAPRLGADAPDDVTRERWEASLGAVPEGRERRRALVSTFAWTSPINAPALLDPESGHARWQALAGIATGAVAPVPVLLELDRGPQPYVMPIAGVDHAPAATLVDAFQRAAERSAPNLVVTLLPAQLVTRLERYVETLRARCTRLEEERDRLDDPARVQAKGDLLLAHFHEIPRGVERVRLDDFEGRKVWLDLDPTAPPDANARRYYDEAARIRRALERLPGLIRDARGRWQAHADLLDRARTGDAAAAEVEASLPAEGSGPTSGGPTLPYRRYRSSGGLEIRVGRGARRNDDLTFRHSAPDDVWLHARDTAGAHVILRWGRNETPPARDLEEAAVLAALGSKARTSGSVPVDWTLRKYVRKPRKAAPGLVIPDRVKTLFVEPDPALEERLRMD